MIYYEREKEAQRAITEMDRYKKKRSEKYIKNKASKQEISSRRGQIQA